MEQQAPSTNRRKRKSQRKDEILQTLAAMLEQQEGRITTAALARKVGVSEAALYRHFPGKAQMYASLIDFMEESLFTRINLILKEQDATLVRCEQVLTLLLGFAEHNPGLSRLLTGDALVGEDPGLCQRINHLFDRIETQVKQILREAGIREGKSLVISTTAAASMLLAIVEGRLVQYVRSHFKRSPTHEWPEQWQHLARGLVV